MHTAPSSSFADNQDLLNAATREYIRAHANDDIRDLALHTQRKNPQINYTLAFDQIAGRRIARTKLPQWAAHEDIIYPPHLAMEQCSSQTTAHIKANIAAQYLGENSSLVDLTGGFGVDFSWIARECTTATYVERQAELCAIAAHNCAVLGLNHVQVINADGVEYLHSMQPVTLIYLDPARRDAHGSRTYAIQDCTPDVLALRDELLQHAQTVMIKLSPMLDWRKTIEDFDGAVQALYVISTGNECKEILVILQSQREENPQIIAIHDEQQITFHLDDDQHPRIIDAAQLSVQRYLYEPNPSIMKTGAFAALQQQWPVAQIGANSHLFVSDQYYEDFPGRIFEIDAVGSLNKQSVKILLAGVEQANVAVRNFPLTAQQLKKKLKVKDGGSVYLFGTTDAAGNHILIKTHKPQN